ncbi:MAG TPA: ABC transporter substrate-binding protein [Thermoanaerobaculia bacterium]|jgi:branched-chain amino acid transport system substrate-binding protein|nr:ABC transporter substrate-binding protein [Thermoanaerobaculia bacterium]
MSPRRRLSPWLALVVVSMTCALSSSCSRGEPEPTEYKIGAVLCLSGRGASYGERAQNGFKLAIDELNAGDFKGKPLRLVTQNTESSRDQARAAFQGLIEKEKITAAVGFLLSDEVLACAPLANQRKVVLLSPFAGSDDIKNAGDYVFRNRESASRQAEAIARIAVERFAEKRFAVLHSRSANGISYRDAFVDAVLRLGIATPPPTVSFEEGKTDYREQIQRLRDKAPEAVYLAGLDRELGLILKQSAELGFKPQFFASAAAISPKLLDIAGTAAEGLVGGSAPFDPESSDPRVQAFVASYEKRFGSPPDFLAANAYDAIHLIADQIRSGARDGESLKKGLYAVKNYPGIGGTMSFDSFGEVDKPITLVQVQKGSFRPLPAEASGKSGKPAQGGMPR